MKFLFDLLPVILFFAAFKIKGIFFATIVAIIASIIQIAWMFFTHRKIEPVMWISLGVIVIFGGATVLLHNETFIKWKPSILYWILGSSLIVGQLLFKKNAMKTIMGKQLILSDAVWNKINLSWAVFFIILGCINLYVAHNFSTDTWVNFKLFGIMGFILVFSIIQGVFISMQQKKDEQNIK